MENLRKYGNAPFNVAVIHGGPGAPGEMALVARELAFRWGVLEPLQTATSLEGQIEELKTVLEKNGDLPVTLIGHSWGAWLSFIFAAYHPSLVKKIILLGSGAFEAKYAKKLMETRLNRLSEEEREEALSLIAALKKSDTGMKNTTLVKFGKLMSKVDAYDPLPSNSEILECQQEIFQKVWPEADKLRKNGKLLGLGKKIQCPVVVIHGDFDSHSVEGVKKPLTRVLKDFRFIPLERCGHKPWIERQARERFYGILKEELR